MTDEETLAEEVTAEEPLAEQLEEVVEAADEVDEDIVELLGGRVAPAVALIIAITRIAGPETSVLLLPTPDTFTLLDAQLDQAIAVVLGATVLAYALYTVAPDTVAKVGSENLLATSSRLIVPRSSPLRVRTATVFVSSSRSPITSM